MTDANVEPVVQVVLGDADPGPSIVQFVLEGEGFAIIGRASSDVELDRVLTGARPDVIVLGDGISAAAAQRARGSVAAASLVVVWPRDVVAIFADERVLPDDVIDELGGAVRRAAAHVRSADEEPVAATSSSILAVRDVVALDVPDAPDAKRHRHRRRVLAAAAMLVVYAAALSTVAAAVTGVWGFGGIRGGRPGAIERPPVLSADGVPASVPDPPTEDVTVGDTSVDRGRSGERPGSDRRGVRGEAPIPPEAPGRDGDPGRGSGPGDNPGRGHGSGDNPGLGHGSGDNPGVGHGSGDNPGRGHGSGDNPGRGNGSDDDPGRGNADAGGDGGDTDRPDRDRPDRDRPHRDRPDPDGSDPDRSDRDRRDRARRG